MDKNKPVFLEMKVDGIELQNLIQSATQINACIVNILLEIVETKSDRNSKVYLEYWRTGIVRLLAKVDSLLENYSTEEEI